MAWVPAGWLRGHEARSQPGVTQVAERKSGLECTWGNLRGLGLYFSVWLNGVSIEHRNCGSKVKQFVSRLSMLSAAK